MRPLYNIKKISSKFTGANKTRPYTLRGKKVTDHHYGVDLLGSKEVLAIADGIVIKVINKGKQYETCCKVRILHRNGYQSAYYHLASGSIRVKVGDFVKAGTYIANMGNTGTATDVHLHLQIDKGTNATAIDPTEYVLGNKDLIGYINVYDYFKVGLTYETLFNKRFRTSAKVSNDNKVKYKNLSVLAKLKAIKDKDGYALYKIGAKIKGKEFIFDNKWNYWMRTNSLYVCVYDSSGLQVKKV